MSFILIIVAKLAFFTKAAFIGASAGNALRHHQTFTRSSFLLATAAVPSLLGVTRKGTQARLLSIMGAALGKTWKGVSYGQNGEVESCVFCKICEGIDRKTEVAYEDQRVIVFKPLARCAAQHWLVVPRQHIQNVKALNAQDIPILSYMREIGEKVLKEKSPNPDPSNQQYVFHVPPVNSIDHLHLHCQVRGIIQPSEMEQNEYTN